VVFQDFKLLKNRTIYENIAIPLWIAGEKNQTVKKRVAEILDQVGLSYKRDEFPDTCSGGEQQRVAIARALIHKPGVLIADEPTGNLDHELAREIMRLFEIANAQGTTVLIATHDISLVQERKAKVVNLKAGELEASA